jgi:hypothetical protein
LHANCGVLRFNRIPPALQSSTLVSFCSFVFEIFLRFVFGSLFPSNFI